MCFDFLQFTNFGAFMEGNSLVTGNEVMSKRTGIQLEASSIALAAIMDWCGPTACPLRSHKPDDGRVQPEIIYMYTGIGNDRVPSVPNPYTFRCIKPTSAVDVLLMHMYVYTTICFLSQYCVFSCPYTSQSPCPVRCSWSSHSSLH